MNFVLLNQFFAPDPAPTGALLTDVAHQLVKHYGRVTVVCGRTPYALAPVRHDYVSEGIDLRRIPGARFGRSITGRLFAYASFCVGAVLHTLTVPDADVVVTLTTPPLLSACGTLAKKVRGTRHVIWEMDVYPDVAVSLGVFRPRGILDRFIGTLADYSRRRADAIIALGPCMRDRLIARGIPPDKIHVAENWADSSRIQPLPRIEDGRLKILYSGNLGLAHDTETIAEAMMWLAEDPRFFFTFAGGGPRRKVIEEACLQYGLPNVAFESYKDASALSEHLGSCDIGLVTQNPATLGCVVPSKTYALMAAARPILFIGPRESTPALNIERFRCGWQIDPGDVNALVNLLNLLVAEPELVREAGRRAYAAFREHCDLPQGVARVARILEAERNPVTTVVGK